MTDTGQIPGEGLPENAGADTGAEALLPPHTAFPGNGAPQQADWAAAPAGEQPAPGYAYLDHPAPPGEGLDDEDDVLLMPGTQGSWSDPQPVPPPAPAPVQQQVPQVAHAVQQPVSLQQPAADRPISVEVPLEVPLETVAQPVIGQGAQVFVAQQPQQPQQDPTQLQPGQPQPLPDQPVQDQPVQAPQPGAVPDAAAYPVAQADAADTAAAPQPQPAAPGWTAPAEPAPALQQPAPPRRPLHMGPPVTDTPSGGVSVRSLADRGPAVTVPGPATSGPEYLDVPRDDLNAIPAQQTGEPDAAAVVTPGNPWPAAPGGASQQSLIPHADSVPRPAEQAAPVPPAAAQAPEAAGAVEAPEVPQEQVQPVQQEQVQQVQPVQQEQVQQAEAAPADVARPEVPVEPEPVAAAPAQPQAEAAPQAQPPAAPRPEGRPDAPAEVQPQVSEQVPPQAAAPVAQAAAVPPEAAAPAPAPAPAPVPAEQVAAPEPVVPPQGSGPEASQGAGFTVLQPPQAPAQPEPAEPEAAPEQAPEQAPEPVVAAAADVAPEAVPAPVPAEVAEAPAPVEPQAEAAAPEQAPAEPVPAARGRRGKRRAAQPAQQPAAPEPETEPVAVAAAEPAAEQPVAEAPADQPAAAPDEAADAAPSEVPEDQEDQEAAQQEQEQDASDHEEPEQQEQPAAAQPAAARKPAAEPYEPAVRDAVHRVIRERRDIRNGFRPDPIPHDVLLRVLEAAHTAPSVGHSQPWDFVVIRSQKTREKMHELAMAQRDAYAKSLPKARARQFRELKIEAILDTPVNIVVTADPTRGGRHTLGRHTQPQMAPYSSALAVENLWIAARAEGIGVGWVSFFDERQMVAELGLPEHLEVVAYLCVGYVDEFPEDPELMQAGWSQRRPLSWVVHDEEYGNRALPGEEPHDLLEETLRGIRPLDAKALGEAWERQKRMTKPAGALGMLEIISAQLSGLSRQCPPPIPEPAAVAVFAGDHGVHAQGVTAWPQEVTGQMVANILGGGAVCNAFANQVGAEVCVIDVGVAAELPATPGLLPRKVRPGTADFTAGPAMSREDVLKAIEVGIETARDLVSAGNKALLTGEMGIANTTSSAAIVAVYTGADPAEVTGRGTGINDEMHARKIDVVRRALELHRPEPDDPIGVLTAIGGLEHAAMVGLMLGAAALRTPVVLDGVSAGAAALVARAIAPEVLAACIAGHRSAEPGHVAALTTLGLRPLVDLDLRLGEGTGALLALPLVQSAARAMHEVATFDAAGVTEKG
ncbi:nicotinate-nucleotide--dimethylbenzimidazole phosphoribosyltransferase [Actinacidiphila sp. bgisy145]|uniref:nicotinate-nucleotide--dimethylbenzimidazole phosphoribosyltransferase n=1 Tax=Actinacidiphila sp. bgisy145 TaxID=3413792 RepID=UPI003EBD23D2